MNALFAAAAEIESFCGSRGWRCTIIGGLAVQRWGEPRQTRDVHITLLSGLGGEERFIDPLLSAYRPRIDDARKFALAHRVVLVETAAGVPLDISLAGLAYETRVIDRSTVFAPAPGVSLTTCSAADLVVLKAFAGRIQDWLDIEAIVVRQGPRLDRNLVLHELGPLLDLKDDRESQSRVEALFAKHPAVQ